MLTEDISSSKFGAQVGRASSIVIFLYFLSGHFGESCRDDFQSKNVTVFSVVMVTFLYHRSFVVKPRLRGNSDALNQSHLQHFSAYTINTRYPIHALSESRATTNISIEDLRLT